MASQPLTVIDFSVLKLFKKGKVRYMYDFGDQLLMVASDRVSAFDFILPDGIPYKGATLTAVSVFWFDYLKDIVANHMITTDVRRYPKETEPYHSQLQGRSMLVKKTELIEIECVVRGYLAGSGWKEYQQFGTVCGALLPKGLRLADPLPEPIFTPAIKAREGHDENVSIERMQAVVGKEIAQFLIKTSLALYEKASAYAKTKGIILADTKFEFGQLGNEIILIDEVLTPDSSRYWPIAGYQPGISPPSFDKQIIRDYLEQSGWDKQPPVPQLPADIILKASEKYREIVTLLGAA